MLIYRDLVPSPGGGLAVRRGLPSPEARSEFPTLHTEGRLIGLRWLLRDFIAQ
jgi:hypothetical protein